MTWLKKKSDPISERARALNSEIAALESQIKRLDAQLHQGAPHPRLRSTALPHGGTIIRDPAADPPSPAHPSAPAPTITVHEPIFEEVGSQPLKADAEAATTPEHFNELGVRKYDFTALIRRVRDLFRGPTTMNPRLVSYLAAGGIQGLQPLRKEKRVARNRFIAFVIILFLILLGTLWLFVRHR